MNDIILMQQIERIADDADAVIERIAEEDLHYCHRELQKEYLMSSAIMYLYKKFTEIEEKMDEIECTVELLEAKNDYDDEQKELNSKSQKKKKDSDKCKCPACVFVRVLGEDKE